MNLIETLDWLNPQDIANNIAYQNDHVAFLYSGAKHSYSGDKSYLAWQADEVCLHLGELDKHLSSNKKPYENIWFGYFGYELKDDLHKHVRHPQNETLGLSPLFFFKPRNLLIFNHISRKIDFYSSETLAFSTYLNSSPNNSSPIIKRLSSNMSKEEYLGKVATIREDIAAGSYYQANLTRKFSGQIQIDNNFSIFQELTAASPAPYSAYLKLENNHIISSSPERFLHIDNQGKVNTRPIKGTIDKNIKNSKSLLRNSGKDQAENLMIVDLMRNDLSITAKTGSVHTDSLFDLDSFSTLHHLSSSVSSQRNTSSLEVIKQAFPPGSMTGAPKLAAMEAISKLENYKRGVYSGAIGYIAGDASIDLSVVIRTIIIEKDKFEFQVGGGIIYDSDPNKEWLETLTKAKAICKALNISMEDIAAL